jgi:hypothetical protein
LYLQGDYNVVGLVLCGVALCVPWALAPLARYGDDKTRDLVSNKVPP